jgi:hypothetical protein
VNPFDYQTPAPISFVTEVIRSGAINQAGARKNGQAQIYQEHAA